MTKMEVEFRFLVEIDTEEIDDEFIRKHAGVIIKDIVSILNDKIGKVSRIAVVNIVECK